MLDFIYDNLKYPSDALEKGIQGRVIVGVVIDENGSVAQPKILKSISPSLDKEALRIVSIMPKWKAGKLNGVPVKVKMSFPVIFKLPNDDNALKTDSLIESIEE
ncbi:energy transducer TonB [Bacteroides fragilis]